MQPYVSGGKPRAAPHEGEEQDDFCEVKTMDLSDLDMSGWRRRIFKGLDTP